MSRASEYDLLLDAIIPLAHERSDYRQWSAGRWGQALNVSDWHRLSPALFCYLRSRSGAPQPVMSALERAYLANAARMLFLQSTIDRVVGALSADGIPSLLLKGAALIETVYPDPAEREMLDVDVLVPDGRHAAAREVLSRLGYHPVQQSQQPESLAAQLNLAHLHEPALVGEQELVAIELHRHITTAEEGGSFTMDGFWKRARVLENTQHALPSPEDLLIHVCLHFTRNRLGGHSANRNTGGALGQVLDISRLVEHEPINWDVLTSTARSYAVGNQVFLGLFAARELGARISSEALAGIAPRGFDPAIGRRLVTLRVLRADDHLPVRSVRWMVAPSSEVLKRGWNADPTATLSLARAYMRRARAHVPAARASLRRPWELLQDHRLNGQISAMEEHT
jgi:hypothetical protein